MIRQDILQRFPGLFATRKVNGRDIDVEETIAMLTRELRPEIAEALTARRRLLQSSEPVRKKYGWPRWDETFQDPVSSRPGFVNGWASFGMGSSSLSRQRHSLSRPKKLSISPCTM